MSKEPETSSAAHGPVVAHRFLLAMLHSPLGRLFGGLCELRFVGRISGRTISLPVQYVREGTQLVVYVGHASGKRWWRNFIDGLSVQTHVGGVSYQGRGRVVDAGHPDRAWAERTYRRHHRRVELLSTDPMVVIDVAAGEAEGYRVTAAGTNSKIRITAWLARHPVMAFTVLAYAISWICWLPLLADRQDWVSWSDLSRFGASTEYPLLPLAAFWVANLLFYGFGEEIGWRGFAVPTLASRRSALSAAIIVSVIWAAWHLPLFGITATYRAMPAVGFLGFFFSMLTASFILTWLYLRSRGSILVVAVFHAAFDIATTTPTTTKLIPMLMGGLITLVGLAVIPSLARTRRAAPAEPAHRS